MSKVGESMIQGAVEALKFVRGKDSCFMIHVPEITNKSESSLSDSKTIKRGSSEPSFNALNSYRKS